MLVLGKSVTFRSVYGRGGGEELLGTQSPSQSVVWLRNEQVPKPQDVCREWLSCVNTFVFLIPDEEG